MSNILGSSSESSSINPSGAGQTGGSTSPVINLSTINDDGNSSVTINNATTDHNAIADAKDIAQTAIDSNETIAGDVVSTAETIATDALGTVYDVVTGAATAVSTAVTELGNTAADAIAVSDAALATSETISTDAIAGNTSVSETAITETAGAVVDVVASNQAVSETAILSSEKTAETAIGQVGLTALDALETTEIVVSDAFGFGGEALDTVDDAVLTVERIAGDAVAAAAGAAAAAADTARDAFGFGKDALDAVSFVSQDAIGLSESVVTLVDKVNAQNTVFLTDTFETGVESIAELSADQTFNIGQVLESVTKLGQVVTTGGESLKTEMQQYLGVGALLVVGLFIIRQTGK